MNKLKYAAAAAVLTVGVSGAAFAEPTFDTLRHDPLAAISAGDQLELEVIPRSELNEVRGESWGAFVVAGLNVINWCIRACDDAYQLIDAYGSAYGVARAAYRDWRRNGKSPDVEGYMYKWLWREGVHVPRY